MTSTINSIFTIIVIITALSIDNCIAQDSKTPCNEGADCEEFEVCYENECIDGCNGIICAVGHKCETITNRPLCLCDEEAGYDLNHQNFCSKICVDSSECRSDQECRAEPNFNKYCYCKTIYSPDQRDARMCEVDIVKSENKPNVPNNNQSSCNSDNECKASEVCEENVCVKICSKIHCNGYYDICIISEDKTATCFCRDGYERNEDSTECQLKKECEDNSQCDKHEVCYENMCIDPCTKIQCQSPLEICTISENHIAECTCAPGHLRNNENNNCERSECESNDHCDDYTICKDNKCIDSCTDISCENDMEVCVAQKNDIGTCECKPSYIRNQETNLCEEGCNHDDDCTKYHACDNHKCIRVCRKMNCNEEFDVCFLNTNHTATCACKEGYSRRNLAGPCEQDNYECMNNNDCDTTMTCNDHKCIHVCARKACRKAYETCVPQADRTAICDCEQGYIRLPNRDTCERKCRIDNDCHVNSMCQIESSSGYHICVCKPGFIKLFFDRHCRRQCHKNIDCDDESRCSQERCVKYTSFENIPKYS